MGFYLTGHPLQDMVEVLRRRRVCLFVEAVQRAEAGDEALRMAGSGAAAPGAGLAIGGEVRLRLPLRSHRASTRCCSRPESLRRCRDVLEPGQAVMIKVRAKAKDGEVRFFGDDAEPVGKAVEADVGGVRIHVAGIDADFSALKRRLEAGSGQRGGEVALVASLDGACEVEMRLPGRFMLDAALRGALKTAPGVRWLEEMG